MMTNVVKEENDCSNISTYQHFLSTLYGERQNLSLNSTSHLNGSVMTVQKSSTVTPFVTSLNQRFHPNFDEVVSSRSTASLINLEKEDSGNICSTMPVINTETDIFRSETPNSSAANFNLVKLSHPTASLVKSEKDSSDIYSMPVINTKAFTVQHTSNNSRSDAIYNIPIENSVSIVVNCGEVTIESVSRPCSYHQNLSAKKKKTETLKATSKNGPVFKTSLVSTGLQSGAFIHIKPSVQPNERPMYVSESEFSFPSYEPIMIKDEPLDFTDSDIKCSEASLSKEPIIMDVCSVNEDKMKEQDLGIISATDDSSVSQQNSHATESSTEDKDYEYLMGILPQLKELPKELKQKFKKDVHNLLTFAVIRGEKLKRKATETD